MVWPIPLIGMILQNVIIFLPNMEDYDLPVSYM